MDLTTTTITPSYLIKEAYERTGYSRLQMCRALNMGTNTVRAIERGEVTPPLSILKEVCALGPFEVPKIKNQSNAQWPAGVFSGMYGDNITSDVLHSEEAALAVNAALEREGSEVDGKRVYPLKTWVCEPNGR